MQFHFAKISGKLLYYSSKKKRRRRRRRRKKYNVYTVFPLGCCASKSTALLSLKGKHHTGKRGKHDLVGLNLDISGVEAFIRARMGKQIDMDGCMGAITTFIVEPFVPHDREFYLSLTSKRLGVDIAFSEAGGVEIEENWDKVFFKSSS